MRLTQSTLRGHGRGTLLAGWEPFEERRFQMLEVSLGTFEIFLQGCRDYTTDAPTDLRVVMNFNHWDSFRSVILLIASREFAPLSFGDEIPKARIVFHADAQTGGRGPATEQAPNPGKEANAE